MKNFIVKKDFWELFPQARFGIIVFQDIDNEIKDESKYEGTLLEAEKKALNFITDDVFINNEVIKVWRDAFKKFKTKKGARCSIEALLKRVHKGNHIGTINPLVDIYNSISLKYALPCGGEDLDTFSGDLRLTKADGNEDFVTLGSGKSEPPYENEIVYKDDLGAVCRCWNWRESVRTMLSEETRNAFLIVESIDKKRNEDLEKATNELAELVKLNLGGKNKSTIVKIDNPVFPLI